MTDRDEQDEQDRTPVGHFRPGHTIKSPGAPKGVSKSEIIRAMLEPNREKACQKLIELTNMGDPAAMKLYFQYLAPPAKPEAEMVKVPGLKDAIGMADKATAILVAVADGQISADAGSTLLHMLETYGRTAAVDRYDRRLDAIDGVSQVLSDDQPSDLA